MALPIFNLVLFYQIKSNEIENIFITKTDKATKNIQDLFIEVEDQVQNLANSIPLFISNGDSLRRKWVQAYGNEILKKHKHFLDLYFAFEPDTAQKISGSKSFGYLLKKNATLYEKEEFNNPTTFNFMATYDPSYQTGPDNIWYTGAVNSKEVFTTPLYYDSSYLKQIMISFTAAGRDLKTGKPLGVAGMDLTAQSFGKILENYKIGKTGGILFTDLSGKVIIPFLQEDYPLLSFKYLKNTELGPNFEITTNNIPQFNIEKSRNTFKGLDGKTYLINIQKVKDRPYYAVAFQDRLEAYTPVIRSTLILTLCTLLLFSFVLYSRTKQGREILDAISTISRNISTNRNIFEDLNPTSKFHRLSPHGPKEIAEIAYQLNLLYSRLQASFQEVEMQRDRAEHATQAKTRFLSVMSHEIRTPINAMLGMIDVLMQSDVTESEKNYLLILQRSGQSLHRILNDILDFSRLESGMLFIDLHEFELFTLISDVENLFRYQAEKKGIKFTVETPDSNYLLLGDSVRMRQAILNLIGNAIKFTKSGGVTFRVESPNSKENLFIFSVIDTGIGIPEDQRSTIFNDFNQADPTISRNFGGTGLGLAISKKIIELMHGTIQLESEVGSGTTFYIHLPIQTRLKWKEVYTNKFPNSFEAPKNTMNPVFNNSGKNANKKILFVDDDEDNQLLMQAYSRKFTEFEPYFANSGLEAIELAKKTDFNLIIMDMQMPVMNGLDATLTLKNLQNEKKTPRCPIIILSANTFPDDVTSSISAGADEHVSKPLRMDDFNSLIKRWILET